VKLLKQADAKDLDKAQVKVVAAGLPGKGNEKPIAAKELTLTLAKPDAELELDVTEKAPLGTLTFHLTGDVDIPYVRNPERVKKAQDEQKRIDALAVELAAEAKKSAEEKTKSEKESADAQAAVAKLKAGGLAEAPVKEAEDKAKAADEAKAKATEADKKLQDLVKAADAAKKEWADELKKATEAAKEQKIKVWFASLSVPLEVVASPVTLKTAADAVTIKAGEKADVAVDVVREFGFADEVKLEMSGGNAPVKVAAVTAAGNQAQVPVALTTEKAAKPGTYTLTLRGSLKFNAKALTVDKTLQVTIEAPAGQ
jgi:myosin heavy subunit